MTTARGTVGRVRRSTRGARELAGEGTLPAQCAVEISILKAQLAAEIVRALQHEGLTLRQAQERGGVAAADFSRIRAGELQRFSLDRLVWIVSRLGGRVEVKICPRRR